MFSEPVVIACDVCTAPAHYEFATASGERLRHYCEGHYPRDARGRWPQGFVLRRQRMAGVFAKSPAVNDPETLQEQFFACQMVGDPYAVRFHLSIATGVNQCALWTDEFLANLREFLAQEFGPPAADCVDTTAASELDASCLRGVLHSASDATRGLKRRSSAPLRAVECLLRHPAWTDEQVAAAVPTSTGQLKRNMDYQALRRLFARYSIRAARGG